MTLGLIEAGVSFGTIMSCYADPRICTVIKCCKQNAISYIEDENEPLGGRIVFDYNKCLESGTCAKECCGDAINMI